MSRNSATDKPRRYPTAFAERNRITIAVVGLLAMMVAFGVAFNAEALPVIGGGSTKQAYFAEAGGIKEGNEVRVAGVKVGSVTDLELDGDKVLITFRYKGVRIGDQTTAAVKVKTTLGQKYLSLDPLGVNEQTGPIPAERTTTPYDVNAAFSDLADTVGEIDTDKLQTSLDVLATTFENTPESVRNTVSGLSDLSRTIASRDEELARLFKATNELSGTLKDRNTEFAALITDGDQLLTELANRREAIGQLLQGTRALGTELEGLVKDNQAQLAPALAKLDTVSAILQRNSDNLERSLSQLGPYYRTIASATGNGPWIDSYICGLFDENQAPVLDNDALRDCSPKKGGGK